jgi:hypothetical protein
MDKTRIVTCMRNDPAILRFRTRSRTPVTCRLRPLGAALRIRAMAPGAAVGERLWRLPETDACHRQEKSESHIDTVL